MRAAVFAVALLAATAQGTEVDAVRDVLNQHYDLAAERAAEPQFFHMTTEAVHFALAGQRTGVETYRLKLKCVPGPEGDKYTCTEFTYREGDGPEQSIPALAGWTYVFKLVPQYAGEWFGIPRKKFEGLTWKDGTPVPPRVAYVIYNSFIDFHAHLDGFGRPSREGAGGIRDLTRIGDKVVHHSANVECPFNLGSNVAEGSYFNEGEITLTLKGVRIVDGAPCALVAYDAGQGSYKIIMEPMPGRKVTNVGTNRYFGEMFIDLKTLWPRKMTRGEFIINQRHVQDPPTTNNTISERRLTIDLVPEEEF